MSLLSRWKEKISVWRLVKSGYGALSSEKTRCILSAVMVYFLEHLMRIGIYITVFLSILIGLVPKPLLAQSPSPTVGAVSPTACVVCEMRTITKKITTTYRSAQGSIVDRVHTITGEHKANMQHVKYQDCLKEDTKGEQIVSDVRQENSTTRVTQT